VTSLKTISLSTILALTVLSLHSQEQLQKIKDKNLIGEWFSKDSMNNLKQKPLLTFYKNPTNGLKDFLATYFKINKNESLKIVRKLTVKHASDCKPIELCGCDKRKSI
jgi:hypothetical protein